MKKNEELPSAEALFRYIPVSEATNRLINGEKRSEVISIIAVRTYRLPDGSTRKFSERSLQRWLVAFEKKGFKGLEPKTRVEKIASRVLSEDQISFFETEKLKDPATSVPDLIRRADARGLIKPNQEIKREALWRCLKRIGLDMSRSATSKKDRDCRRFAYPNRMDMILCDGKHFRAGASERKRVALFFLDDSTRKCLGVVVGTSENTTLFLKGLYQVLTKHGKPTSIFLDNGPGFIANDTINVVRQLGIMLIHGTAGYPEGHGKIERFNRTVLEQELRLYRGNPNIDPDCLALQTRLGHFLFKHYNHIKHEGIEKQTPYQCFAEDPKELNSFESISQLKDLFILRHRKNVRNDRTLSFKGTVYEVPIGYAGRTTIVLEKVLDSTLSMDHENNRIRLHPVDPVANATDRRAKSKPVKEPQETDFSAKSAAQIKYDHKMSPVTNPDGGFSIPDLGEK